MRLALPMFGAGKGGPCSRVKTNPSHKYLCLNRSSIALRYLFHFVFFCLLSLHIATLYVPRLCVSLRICTHFPESHEVQLIHVAHQT